MYFLQFIEKVYSYLEQRTSLEDLEDWLIPRLPLFFSLPKSSMTELVSTVELGLAEMSSRALSEEEFRGQIRDYLHAHPPTTFQYLEAHQTTSTAADAAPTLSVLSFAPIPPGDISWAKIGMPNPNESVLSSTETPMEAAVL